jgi:hypothetical protein
VIAREFRTWLNARVRDVVPQILQIYRDYVMPGGEATYRAIEEDAARICVELACPHPHLAIESLDSPHEVWWLNAYGSETQVQQVAAAYQANVELTAALAAIARRKEAITGRPSNELLHHRPDLSTDQAWDLGGARFMVVAETLEEHRLPGSVYEAPDGRRVVLRIATAPEAADALVRAGGLAGRIFAVRPYWGLPSPDWIAAAPAFWSANPAAAIGS